MLAVQRYRPEKYPPTDDFVQFGDSFLKRGVAAHTAAVQKLAERRYSDLHSQRLNEKGFVMMSREDFPRSRRDSWSDYDAPMHERNDEYDPRDPLAPGVAAYNMFTRDTPHDTPRASPQASPQASPRDPINQIRRRQDNLPQVVDSDLEMEDARSVLSGGVPEKKVSNAYGSALGTLASGVGAGLGAFAEGAGKGIGAITQGAGMGAGHLAEGLGRGLGYAAQGTGHLAVGVGQGLGHAAVGGGHFAVGFGRGFGMAAHGAGLGFGAAASGSSHLAAGMGSGLGQLAMGAGIGGGHLAMGMGHGASQAAIGIGHGASQAAIGIVRSLKDVERVISNLRHSEPSKGRTSFASLDDAADTNTTYMSYDDVQGWMDNQQNVSELVDNVFMRDAFWTWLHTQPRLRKLTREQTRHVLRQWKAEDLATMLVALDHHM